VDALAGCLVIILEEAYVLAIATLHALANALKCRYRQQLLQLQLQQRLDGGRSSLIGRPSSPAAALSSSEGLALRVSPSSSSSGSFLLTPASSAGSLADASTGYSSDGSSKHAANPAAAAAGAAAVAMDLDGCYEAFFDLLPALRTAVNAAAQRPQVRLALGAWHPVLPPGGDDDGGASATNFDPTEGPAGKTDAGVDAEAQQQQQQQQQLGCRTNMVIDRRTGALGWNPAQPPPLSLPRPPPSPPSAPLLGAAAPARSVSSGGGGGSLGVASALQARLRPPALARAPGGLPARQLARKPSLSRMPLPPSPFKALAASAGDVFIPSFDLGASHDLRRRRPPPPPPSLNARAGGWLAAFPAPVTSAVAQPAPRSASLLAHAARSGAAAPTAADSKAESSVADASFWSFDALLDVDSPSCLVRGDEGAAAGANRLSSASEEEEFGDSANGGSDLAPSFRPSPPGSLLRPPSFLREPSSSATEAAAALDALASPPPFARTAPLLRPPSFVVAGASVAPSNDQTSTLANSLALGPEPALLFAPPSADGGAVAGAASGALEASGASGAASAAAALPPEPPLGLPWGAGSAASAQAWRTVAIDADARDALGRCLGAFRAWGLGLPAGGGRLRVSHEVGRGGCATVYLAYLALPLALPLAAADPSDADSATDDASGRLKATAETAADTAAAAAVQWAPVALKKLEVPAGAPRALLSRALLDFQAEAATLHRLRFAPTGDGRCVCVCVWAEALQETRRTSLPAVFSQARAASLTYIFLKISCPVFF
jgi:hypothetical protein